MNTAFLTQNLTFGQALEAAKEGKCICREGWNGKGMYLILFSQAAFITVDIEEGELVAGQVPDIDKYGYTMHTGDEGTRIEHMGIISQEGHKFFPIEDFFLLKTAGNTVVPWNASQPDTLASDWAILR